jgi:hypothetical protein
MAQSVVVKLIDDIDGGDAEETVTFALDGRTYEIDLNPGNAAALREALARYVDKARPVGRASSTSLRTTGRTRERGASKTLFSSLDAEEKERFRKWADLPSARRIADGRVQQWMDAGRP